MALQEPIRSSIFTHFEELLGTEEAAALMREFPNYDITDVVTNQLLDARLRESEALTAAMVHAEVGGLRLEVQQEFAAVRSEMSSEFAAVRSEMSSEFAAVRSEMSSMRSELKGDMHALDVRLSAVEHQLVALPDIIIKQLLFWLVPIMLTAIGLVYTVSHITH